MRTVNPARDALKKRPKASTKPQSKNPATAPEETLSEQHTPTASKGVQPVGPFIQAQIDMAKKVRVILSPSITVPVLDETPIAVPAPGLTRSPENITKVLPEGQIRGTVDRGQAALDIDLRQRHKLARTARPQMQERLRTLRGAQRELLRRKTKPAKPRPARINHQRIGKTSITLWLKPALLERIDRIAGKRAPSRQEFITAALEHIATMYEQAPAENMKALDNAAAELKRLQENMQRIAGTLAVASFVPK